MNISTSILTALHAAAVTHPPPVQPVWTGQNVRGYGDSNMVGHGLTDTTKRWMTVLCAAKGAVEVNGGVSGMSMEYNTSAAYDAYWPQRVNIPTKVSTDALLIFDFGENDAVGATSVNGFSIAAFTSQYYDVVDAAVAKGWALTDIVLASFPAFPALASLSFKDQYCQAIRDIAAAKHTCLADFYGYTRDMTDFATTYLQSDGMHLNVEGHQLKSDFMGALSYVPR